MPVTLTNAMVSDLVGRGVRSRTFDRQQGLVLAANVRSSTWEFVYVADYQKRRLALGKAPELSIDDARSLAAKASDLVRQGFQPDDQWVRDQRTPQPDLDQLRKTWTFRQAREAYLDDKKESLKQASQADYRKTLTHRSLVRFEMRFVADITDEDLSAVVYEVHKSGREAQAAAIRRHLSMLWNWLSESRHRTRSGVSTPARIDKPRRSYAKAETPRQETRAPHPGEVALALKKALGGELGAASAAIALVLTTAQRRTTVAKALLEDVEDGVWYIPPVNRKTALRRRDQDTHVLPWPPSLPVPEEGVYLFPADRVRRKGMPRGSVAPDTITHNMRENGVGFTPHDVRRSFTTTMRLNGISKAQARIILDHKEGGSDVIDEHYDMFQDMPEKLRMLELWWSYLDGSRTVGHEEWRRALGQRRRSTPKP